MLLFKERKLVIATKHKKERVIAPLAELALGVKCIVGDKLDTDLLGTFSGEKARSDTPLQTAKLKCDMAMNLYDCDMAIASEGSFGPHPYIFGAVAADEVLFFADRKNKLEIAVRELSTETNFAGATVDTMDALRKFCEAVRFPSHAVIIRKSENDYEDMVKGISDWNLLEDAFLKLKPKWGSVHAETDMRALYNPTRMKMIGLTAKKLMDKIQCCCPDCGTPGFGVREAKPGLPCSLCGFRTQSTLSYIYGCNKCGCIKEEFYPHNKTTEDPMYCDVCNP